MELQQLRYLLAVAQAGTFTKAAAVCRVAQPSLSAQIAKLERELGGPLFERGRHGARLTQRGQILRSWAADALGRLDAAKRELEELSGLKRGRVVIGCLPTTGGYLLPKLLTVFIKRYPNIHVDLQEASSPRLAQALRDFEIDLAILDEAGLGPGITSTRLFSEPLVLALPSGHRLEKRKSIDLSALTDEPFILMKSGHGFRTIVMDALTHAGVKPRVVYESDQIETVQRLVEARFGISIVPCMVKKPAGLSYIAINPPAPSRTLLVAYRDGTGLSAAAECLRATAKQVLNG